MNTTDREKALLVDVSLAGNSAQALRVLEDFVLKSGAAPGGGRLEVNAGALLLTQSVLSRMKHLATEQGLVLETLFATLPQTQQAALDEGFFVREKLLRRVEEPTEPVKEPEQGGTSENAPSEEPPVLPVLPVEKPVLRAVPLAAGEELPGEDGVPTLLLKQTLRSGRVLHYDGNLVIIGDVHTGSEITATGDIVIWGELRGIAHAGSQGNYQAEIRALKIEALQLRIAEYIARRPDRIYYHKEMGSELALAPEIAKVADGEIKIFKETIER